MTKKVVLLLRKYRYFLLLFLLVACVEPIEPDFNFKEGLVYIDAFLSTGKGTSLVNIFESRFIGSNLRYKFVSGASVSFINIDTGILVSLNEHDNAYIPPSDFEASVGEEWKLMVTFPDGRNYESLPELITEPVEISKINYEYNPELIFSEDSDGFLPGHSVFVDIEDPVDSENYYLWKFRSFEKIELCDYCFNGILRNGECIDPPMSLANEDPVITIGYRCESDCWRVRYNENVKIFADEFSNGGIIKDLPIADIFLYSRKNIAVEIQQLSLTRKAYDYFKVLKDLVENNGGLNAPPPAALIGNMFNPNDDKEFVLGRFTAAAASKKSIFIDRRDIKEVPITTTRIDYINEYCELFCTSRECYDALCEESLVLTSDCTESQYRTAIEPEAWIE
ncbi:DUF4249 domain-containing protein [Flavivirga algicola]|uniref:DUF4249 domain-containing protein n=1 Tax=Flavivirga algicola TaxID=2729136 RepID=A0ABX1RYL8_9FLAO|nr:DUF4249 domain-containing protein [Flavivirga algicola]NMH87517.1 DUF4249 domain-containing protein [Flavivirga algicola]